MDFDELESLAESQSTSHSSNKSKDKHKDDDASSPKTNQNGGESSLERHTNDILTHEKHCATFDSASENRDEDLSDSCDCDAESNTEEQADPGVMAHDAIKGELLESVASTS